VGCLFLSQIFCPIQPQRQINSHHFLGCDRLAAFQALADEEEPAITATLRETMQRDALTLLKSDNKDGWNCAEGCVWERTDSGGLCRGRSGGSLQNGLCRASCRGFPGGIHTSSSREYFSGVCREWCGQDAFQTGALTDGSETAVRSEAEETITLSGRLMEAALNLSRCELTSSERVSEFAAIVADLASAWPRLGQAVLPIIQEMCDDLPIGQTAEMWRLNLRLRSQ